MDKSILKSKTFYVSLVVALAPLFPAVQALVAANPEMVGAVLGGVFTVLRLVSAGKVSIL